MEKITEETFIAAIAKEYSSEAAKACYALAKKMIEQELRLFLQWNYPLLRKDVEENIITNYLNKDL